MYRLSKSDRKELLELTRENNKVLRAILSIIVRDRTQDFRNNIIANIISNGIMPNSR